MTEAAAGSEAQTGTQTSNQTDDKGAAGAAGGAGGAAGAEGAGAAGAAGADDKPWHAGFAADLQNDPTILKYKTPEDAARALSAAVKKLGVPADQLVRLPTDPADRAAVQEIYKRLGAPEDAKGYKIDVDPELGEPAKALADGFSAHMFEKGPFPPDAVQAAVDFWNMATTAKAKADGDGLAARTAEAETALKGEWGAAYDQRTKDIGGILNEFGGEKLAAELEKTPLGDKPELMRFLSKIVELRGEPGALTGADRGAGQRGGLLTPSQAKGQRIELESDAIKGVALRDKEHPMHAAVVKERTRLLELEHPSK